MPGNPEIVAHRTRAQGRKSEIQRGSHRSAPAQGSQGRPAVPRRLWPSLGSQMEFQECRGVQTQLPWAWSGGFALPMRFGPAVHGKVEQARSPGAKRRGALPWPATSALPCVVLGRNGLVSSSLITPDWRPWYAAATDINCLLRSSGSAADGVGGRVATAGSSPTRSSAAAPVGTEMAANVGGGHGWATRRDDGGKPPCFDRSCGASREKKPRRLPASRGWVRMYMCTSRRTAYGPA